MPDLTIESSRMCCSNEYWEREVTGSSGKKYTVRFGNILGPEREARMCSHDFTCTCTHFQMRLRYKEGAYCKHIKQVRSERCGWHGVYGGGLDPSPLSEDEQEAAEAEDRCPSCGGETVAIQVAV